MAVKISDEIKLEVVVWSTTVTRIGEWFKQLRRLWRHSLTLTALVLRNHWHVKARGPSPLLCLVAWCDPFGAKYF